MLSALLISLDWQSKARSMPRPMRKNQRAHCTFFTCVEIQAAYLKLTRRRRDRIENRQDIN